MKMLILLVLIKTSSLVYIMGTTITCCSTPEEKQPEQNIKSVASESIQPLIYTYPAFPQFPRSLSGTTLRPYVAN